MSKLAHKSQRQNHPGLRIRLTSIALPLVLVLLINASTGFETKRAKRFRSESPHLELDAYNLHKCGQVAALPPSDSKDPEKMDHHYPDEGSRIITGVNGLDSAIAPSYVRLVTAYKGDHGIQSLIGECGGTVLSPTVVLTSASCIGTYTSSIAIYGNFTQFSRPNLVMDAEPLSFAKHYCRHPQFVIDYAPHAKYDLAIIVLQTPLYFQENALQAACLEPDFKPLSAQQGKYRIVSASGGNDTDVSEGKRFRTILSAVKVTPDCSSGSDGEKKGIPTTTSCMRMHQKIRPCSTESGAPLFLYQKRNGKWRALLKGVTSFRHEFVSTNCLDTALNPVVTDFSKIGNHVAWLIDECIKSDQ